MKRGDGFMNDDPWLFSDATGEMNSFLTTLLGEGVGVELRVSAFFRVVAVSICSSS
jgi:hypothetical protein